MSTVIVSDLHLGSRHCRGEEFLQFLAALPAGAALVLNGDVVDRWQQALPPRHQAVLDALRAESFRRRVVWVRGNHDERFVLADAGRIEFAPSVVVERGLWVAHGHHFDLIMPRHRLFIVLMRVFHRLRLLLGADAVHVAHYAKKFAWLYGVLRRHVIRNAAWQARLLGHAAVACGHTHFVEETVQDGIRYLNTGSWTEPPLTRLWADGGILRLEPALDNPAPRGGQGEGTHQP
jgi:UDP-2,3-diacylglucosamine pyrophosphatase LpxH